MAPVFPGAGPHPTAWSAVATSAVIVAVCLFLSRRFIQKDWKKGIFFRLIGGMLTALNSAMGMVTLVLVVEAYPFSG